jgi:CRP-like cAMP-binding protein
MKESLKIQKYCLFNGLEREQLDSVMAKMNEETYDAGADIIIEGTYNGKIFFILEGRVAAVKGGIILEVLGEGAFFGEMEVLDTLPSAATVKALALTKVMVLSIDALGDIYENDLSTYSFIVMNLARDLSRRLRRMDSMVASESPLMEWN